MRSRLALRTLALGYLAVLLVAPVGFVFYRTFEHGAGTAWHAVTTPAATHAFWLTVELVAIAIPLNTIFGIVMALALVRGRWRGRAVGEFGSIVLISGNRPFKTEVASVFIYGRIQSDDITGAAAVSIVLLLVSLAILIAISVLGKRAVKDAE